MGKVERVYLPTLAELIDRLSIVLLKEIFIQEHSAEYRAERALIEHDIGLLMDNTPTGRQFRATEIRAVMMIMLANHYIWENESRAREGHADQDQLLKLTHSVNGVRNTAKNVISSRDGDRLDYKVDSFAADLIEKFGNWRIFE